MIKKILNFYRASIKRELIFGIAFVHAIMMSVFIFDLVKKEHTFLNLQHTKSAKSLSKTLASASTSWVLANDVIGLKEVLSSIKYYPAVNYAFIINKEGYILAHTNKQYIGKYLSDKKSLSFLKSNIETKIIFENNNYIDIVSPILRDKQHIGWARIALNKEEINKGVYNVTKNGIIYTLLAVIVGVIFAYVISIGITNGIYTILKAIKKVKEEDLHIHSNVNRVDEIGILSYEFDHMIDVVKSSKDKLKKANERFNLTIEGLEDGIWDWNLKTDKAYFSHNWKMMLGYKDDEIENTEKAFFSLIKEEYKEKVKYALNKHFENPLKNKYSIDIKMRCKDGSYKWILSRGKAILDENKKPIRMLGYHTDITKEKNNEEALLKQKKLLEEQSKMVSMGEMIGNISHQWRQPLSVISTGATGIILKKEYDMLKDEELISICNSINENAQYLSKTIDDFKNFIKGDREKTIFNIGDSVKTFLHLVEGTIKSNEINIIKNINEDIKINSYSNELIQCFINIFNNAKDALKNIKTNRYIFISYFMKDNNIVITFRDNGGGIPNDVLPHIFEPYFTTKHKSQGTGLGLHMTYNSIVNGMNGTIEAHNVDYEYNNEKLTGAEFIIKLSI